MRNFRAAIGLFLCLLFAQGANAAITYVSTGAVTQSAADTISPAIPAGAAGDLILCTAGYHNPNYVLPTPTGASYTELSSGYAYHKVWGRIATGSDAFTLGTAVTAPLSGYIESFCVRYRGASATLSTIVDVSSLKHTSLTDQLRLGALTPTVGNEMLFYSGRYAAAATSIASPTSFTERVDSSYTASSTTMVAGDWVQGGSKSTSNQQDLAVTGGSGTSISSTSIVLAIKVAGAGGTGGSIWSFRSVGTVANANSGNITPGLPAGQQAGDWLCWYGIERNTANTLAHPAGYTAVVSRATGGHDFEAMDCKVSIGASEVAPTTTLTGQGMAQIAAFIGGPSVVSGNVHATANSGGSCTQNPITLGLTITQPNSLLIEFAELHADYVTLTSPPTGFTTISAPVFHGTNDTSALWAYQIQTTATTTSNDQFTTTPAGASVACSRMSAAFLVGSVSGPTITNVNTTNTYNATAVGLVITGTGFGASQGTGSVTLRDGSLSSTQTVTSWSDTSITFTSVLGDDRYGADNIRVTTNAGTFADQAVAVTTPPTKCSFNLGTLAQPFAVDQKGAPNRFGDAASDIADDSQLELSALTFNAGSTCANISIQSNGTFKVPTDLLSLNWIWNNGTGWKDTAANRTGANKIHIKPSGGFRVSCSSVLGDNTTPPVRPPATSTICSTGCNFPNTSTGISNCMAGLANGQSCEMRAIDPTAPEIWAAHIDITSINGVEGNVKTLRVRDGDSITLAEAVVAPQGLLGVTTSSYINIQGNSTGSLGLIVADPAEWASACAISATATGFSGTHNCYINGKALMITGSNNIGVMNMTVHGANADVASEIDNTSTYIYFRQDQISLHGINNNFDPTAPSPSGDLMLVNADHFLSEDTTFSHGGNTALSLTGSFGVLRRVVGDGGWSDLTNDTVYTGSHPILIQPADCSVASYGCSPYGPVAIEDSEFRGAGLAGGGTYNVATQFMGIGTIFRRNYIYANKNSFLLTTCQSRDINTTTFREGDESIYNNTLFGGPTFLSNGASYPSGIDGQICRNMLVADNLFQGAEPSPITSLPADFTAAWAGLPLGGFTNSWKGARIFANVFAPDPSAPSLNMQYNLTGTGAATKFIIDSATWPSNVFSNRNVTVKWANGTTLPDLSRQGLVLAPTNTVGIGDSVAITAATNSGTAVTSITLATARPFKDDWGFSGHTFGGFHHEYGDCIAVGPTAASTIFDAVSVRIADAGINYTTGVVTLVTPITFAVGSPVWKAVDYLDGTCGRALRNRGAAQ